MRCLHSYSTRSDSLLYVFFLKWSAALLLEQNYENKMKKMVAAAVEAPTFMTG